MLHPIISVTGTKGKTTTVHLVSEILAGLGSNVLKVNTTGHYVNGVKRSTLKDSLDNWGLVSSVAPGRFLYEFMLHPKLARDGGVAVLECSLGSSTLSGMGYALHEVGVFLNIFEDHLGSTDRLKTKTDILDAKAFIFKRIRRDGYAVFNADDELVTQGLQHINKDHNISLLPFGMDFLYLDTEAHVANGGSIVTIEEGCVVVKSNTRTDRIVALNDLPWTFNGRFKPSVYNLMAAIAAVVANNKGVVTKNLTKAVASVRLDPEEGRLTLYRSKQDVTIIADYAHEKVSLVEVAKLAHELKQPGDKVIGVVRLAYDRTDELIKETGEAIAGYYDTLVVYDKIDGYLRQPKDNLHGKFQQKVGYVSEVFANAIKSKNKDCYRVIREDEAAQKAADLAQPGDVVVYIVNDDISRSNEFIKEKFTAALT